jgi:type II secretory pathway pseudopilin PulG
MVRYRLCTREDFLVRVGRTRSHRPRPQQEVGHISGFTLIEALITTVILVSGLAAIAGAFSYSSVTALRMRQHTAALILVAGKMEDLKVSEDLPIGRYSEYLEIASDGVIVTAGPGATYLRDWDVTGETPNRITVTLYARQAGKKGRYFELARATTKRGRTF